MAGLNQRQPKLKAALQKSLSLSEQSSYKDQAALLLRNHQVAALHSATQTLHPHTHAHAVWTVLVTPLASRLLQKQASALQCLQNYAQVQIASIKPTNLIQLCIDLIDLRVNLTLRLANPPHPGLCGLNWNALCHINLNHNIFLCEFVQRREKCFIFSLAITACLARSGSGG